jgi:hypothetical protein
LLYQVFAVNAVDSELFKIKPIFVGDPAGILVKNWTFNTGSLPGPWTHRVDWNDPTESEISSQPDGVEGQGTDIPLKKVFSLHYIAMQSGRIFDPSYGTIASETPGSSVQLDWEENSLDGYVKSGEILVSEIPIKYEEGTAARVEDPDDLGTVFTAASL